MIMMMSLWRKTRGQVTLEYCLIFAAVMAVVIAGLAAFSADIKGALEGFMNGAAAKIAK